MTRLDYLLDALSAAVERRNRLEDIERERKDDFCLIRHRVYVGDAEAREYQTSLDACNQAEDHRQAADQSVLAIAVDVADEWGEKKT